jgi:hypothetical protein
MSAQILTIDLLHSGDLEESATGTGGGALSENADDPVYAYVALEQRKKEYLAAAADSDIEQKRLIWSNWSNPGFRNIINLMQRTERGAVESVKEFFSHSDPEPQPVLRQETGFLTKEERIRRAADPMYWSPKLKALVERKIERQKARKKLGEEATGSTVVGGEGLSPEEIRYYAEDVNLEDES